MLPVDEDVKQEQEWSHGRSCTSTLGAGRENMCGDSTCAPGWLTDIIPTVKVTFGGSYSSSRKVFEMLWYFKIKGQTVAVLEYDTSWWRFTLTSVVFLGSSLGLRKPLISSASHTFLRVHASLVFTTFYIAYFVVFLSVQEQDCNPLQNYNCTFHLQLVSTFHPFSCQYDMTTVIIRETDHQLCLPLPRETILDPWAGHWLVNRTENSLGSISFQFIRFSQWKLFMSSVLHQSFSCHSWACKNKLCYCTRPYHVQLWTLF